MIDEMKMWERRPDWELRNMVKALGMMSWLNTPEQNLRLEMAQAILRERAKRKRAARKK